MMLSITLMLLISVTASTACNPSPVGEAAAVPTEELAVAVAKEAWRDKFSADYVSGWEPYQGELVDGAWHVYGTVPGGARGGTPEAMVCARDGEVLRVFHTQ